MTTRRVLAPLALTAIVLSGCAGRTIGDGAVESSPAATSVSPSETPTPQPTSPATTTLTGTPTASATPLPTETPKADAPPSLDDLKLSSEGLGYVRVGQPVPAHDPKSAIVQWKQPYCEGADADGPGGFKTLYSNADNGNLVFYVESAEKSAPVNIIYIISEKIHTEHGLHNGSPLATVKALGGKKESGVGGGTEAWVIHGSQGELVSFVEEGIVQQLQVQQEGSKPAFHLEITPCE